MAETMAASNLHGTALVVGDRGVLIDGGSGSGKTTLALGLLTQLPAPGRLVRLIGDDQLLFSSHGGRLVCAAPSTISGLAEVHGLGPRPLEVEEAAIIDLVVRLLPAEEAERFPEDATETICDCITPLLRLRERNTTGSVLAVWARLSMRPFG
jgi:serine kinase of HPr protein (carbohydrate metabolism regulator)